MIVNPRVAIFVASVGIQLTFGQSIVCGTAQPSLATFSCGTTAFIQTFCNRVASSGTLFGPGDELFRCFFNTTTNGNCVIRLVGAETITTPQKADASICAATLFSIAGQCPLGGHGNVTGSPLGYGINSKSGGCSLDIGLTPSDFE